MSDHETRSSCSSDSVDASDLSESAADSETMENGMFEAQAAMATQAGHMSRFANGDTTSIHLKHVADMLRVHDVRHVMSESPACGRRSPPEADKFLRESFIAMKRLWMDRSHTAPQRTLENYTHWNIGSEHIFDKKRVELFSEPGKNMGRFMTFVLNVVRDPDACDSVVEAGFDLLDAITRSRCRESDRDICQKNAGQKKTVDTGRTRFGEPVLQEVVEEGPSHYGFTTGVLMKLMDVAFCVDVALCDSRPATTLRATQTLSTYIKRSSSDPPIAERAESMLRAGLLRRLMPHIGELVRSREKAKGGFWRDDERGESDASDGTAASHSGKVSIESVGHADGEEHAVRRVTDAPSGDVRLLACLSLLNGALRAADSGDVFDTLLPMSDGVKMTRAFMDLAVIMTRARNDGDDRGAYAANEKRKALEALTAMARRRPKCGERRVAIFACVDEPTAMSCWRQYIFDHCVFASPSADPFDKAYETESRRRSETLETPSSEETFYRRAPLFDARLAAADVGLALRDAAELFEVDGLETGSAEWFEEVERYRAHRNSESSSLVELVRLAASRGFYSLGSSLHWHTMCAHAGAVLHAAMFANVKGDARDWLTPELARGTPDLLRAATDLEERCRGTVHESLARRAKAIVAATSARMGYFRALLAPRFRPAPPAHEKRTFVKRKRRESYRVTQETNGRKFYELL
jgi:hypothetical protein